MPKTRDAEHDALHARILDRSQRRILPGAEAELRAALPDLTSYLAFADYCFGDIDIQRLLYRYGRPRFGNIPSVRLSLAGAFFTGEFDVLHAAIVGFDPPVAFGWDRALWEIWSAYMLDREEGLRLIRSAAIEGGEAASGLWNIVGRRMERLGRWEEALEAYERTLHASSPLARRWKMWWRRSTISREPEPEPPGRVDSLLRTREPLLEDPQEAHALIADTAPDGMWNPGASNPILSRITDPELLLDLAVRYIDDFGLGSRSSAGRSPFPNGTIGSARRSL